MPHSHTLPQRKLDSPWIKGGLIVGFYLVFGMAYWAVISITSGGSATFFKHMLLDYGMKAIMTIPIWLLMFRWIKDFALWKKMLIHLALLPIWVIVWQQGYYAICDALGWWHLGWPAGAWDLYIPGLFYIMQFGIFHLYVYDRQLREQKEKEIELRNLAIQSELSALKAQLNPHFLYNTFNTISASVPAEQEHTREMIAKLADLFRYQLKASREEVVPLWEEARFLRKYLDLEKERMGDRLSYEVWIPPGIEAAMIPPMLLQPLVENAIKHGISPKIEGGEVKVVVEQTGNRIYFTLSDTGVGMDKEDPIHMKGGVGLSNTIRRLERMYGCQLKIDDNTPQGVKITFDLPADIHSDFYLDPYFAET